MMNNNTNTTNNTNTGNAKVTFGGVMKGLGNGLGTFWALRSLIGLFGAIATTIVSIVLLATGSENIFLGIFMGIIVYILSGGFLMALRTVWEVTKVAYFIVPTWLFGVMAAILAFFFMLIGVLMFPIIFVLIKFFRG